MVVKEDGSKWACQSCLKGHRVSGCTHVDRELTLVPKKGRPVTQCQHCRQERKKRSAHVSCDCGQPDKQHHAKEKCVHLREAEEKAKAGGYYHDELGEKDTAYLARIAEEQGCCCGHGGTCTCALLMKDLDNGLAPHGPAVKPKLEKMISEGSITVFQNGHHKPVHRKNHAAHECGMPYKVMPRHPSDQSVSTAARRSVDSLALDTSQAGQSSDFLPPSTSPFNTERRKSKSEQPSPRLFPLGEGFNGLADTRLSSIDFSMLSQTQTNQSVQSTISESFGIPSFDPMSGMAESSFDPWSAFPSADSMTMPNNNPFTVWPTPPNDNVHIGQPALTAASSGTTSEIDEIPAIDETFDYMPSIQEDPNMDFSNFATGSSPQMNRRSLPPGFFGNVDFAGDSAGGEWAIPGTNYDGSNANKMQSTQNRPTTSFDQVWQMPDVRPPINMAQRQLGGLPHGTRPQSRSVGPSSAPSDDIIKQLFPDIDVNGSIFAGSPSLSQMGLPKDFNGLPPMTPTSAPLDYGPMDETSNGFTSHPWSDGSMTIPSDVVTTSYNAFDQDFSNPDFSGNWSQ